MERRKFIQNTLAILAPTVISGNPVFAIQDHPFLNLNSLASSKNNNALVIIQLNGGNDGFHPLPMGNFG